MLRRPRRRPAGRPSRAGGASCRRRVGDVGDVADGVDAGEARRRSGPAVRRSGRRDRSGSPPAPAIVAADSPPPQTTVRVGIVVPSSSSTRSGCTDGDAGLEPDLGPLLGEPLVRVGVGLRRRRRPAAPSPRSTRKIRPGRGISPSAASARVSSASAPATSTPVGPPPTTTTSRASSRAWASSPAASTRSWKWSRSRSASATEYSGNACSAAPGTPKYSARPPAARTRCEPLTTVPSARVRLRAPGSSPVTSAVRTSTVGYSRKIVRCGRAMSSAGSCDVATW